MIIPVSTRFNRNNHSGGFCGRRPPGMNDSTLTDADFEPAALDMLSSGPQVVFLTGKAGTGKSTLVNH